MITHENLSAYFHVVQLRQLLLYVKLLPRFKVDVLNNTCMLYYKKK